MNPPGVWLKTGTGLTNTHTARGFSVLYHVFVRKQCISGSALRHSSNLTLPYDTSIRDSFCLGTFADGLNRLPPRSLASSRACSLAIVIISLCLRKQRVNHNLQRVFHPEGGGGGVVPYIRYVGMCGAKGYGFLAVLVWNRVSISTILVWNRVWFVHSSLELGMFFRRISYFFIIWR